MNLDPSAYPTKEQAFAVLRGYGIWLFVLLTGSLFTLLAAGIAIGAHYFFDKIFNWVIPDSFSMIRQALEAATSIAFGFIGVILLVELVQMFWKFRNPHKLTTSTTTTVQQGGSNDTATKANTA